MATSVHEDDEVLLIVPVLFTAVYVTQTTVRTADLHQAYLMDQTSSGNSASYN